MNARQKAKHYKKALEMLYQDYEYSAFRANEMITAVHEKIEKHEERMVTCMVSKCFDKPVEVTDEIFEAMTTRLFDLYCNFKEAVVFEGHTDPDTGKYILEAKLTVVMPEFEREEEES